MKVGSVVASGFAPDRCSVCTQYLCTAVQPCAHAAGCCSTFYICFIVVQMCFESFKIRKQAFACHACTYVQGNQEYCVCDVHITCFQVLIQVVMCV